MLLLPRKNAFMDNQGLKIWSEKTPKHPYFIYNKIKFEVKIIFKNLSALCTLYPCKRDLISVSRMICSIYAIQLLWFFGVKHFNIRLDFRFFLAFGWLDEFGSIVCNYVS